MVEKERGLLWLSFLYKEYGFHGKEFKKHISPTLKLKNLDDYFFTGLAAACQIVHLPARTSVRREDVELKQARPGGQTLGTAALNDHGPLLAVVWFAVILIAPTSVHHLPPFCSSPLSLT